LGPGANIRQPGLTTNSFFDPFPDAFLVVDAHPCGEQMLTYIEVASDAPAPSPSLSI